MQNGTEYISGVRQYYQRKGKYMAISVDIYKKCLKCGDKYHIESNRMKCLCGGHLYTVGTIYQETAKGSRERGENGC